MKLKAYLLATAFSLTVSLPAYAQDHSASPMFHCPKGAVCHQGGPVLDPPPHRPVLDPPPPGTYGGPTGIWRHPLNGGRQDPPLATGNAVSHGPARVWAHPPHGPVLDPPPSAQSDGLRHGPVADPGPSGGIWKGHRKLDPPSGE